MTVRVANGTQVPGLAGKITNYLASKGYDVVAPVNANAQASASMVYYSSGFQYQAITLAQDLALSQASVAPYSTSVPLNLPEEDITVVVGPDLSVFATG